MVVLVGQETRDRQSNGAAVRRGRQSARQACWTHLLGQWRRSGWLRVRRGADESAIEFDYSAAAY